MKKTNKNELTRCFYGIAFLSLFGMFLLYLPAITGSKFSQYELSIYLDYARVPLVTFGGITGVCIRMIRICKKKNRSEDEEIDEK